jgi:hypothetical protein
LPRLEQLEAAKAEKAKVIDAEIVEVATEAEHYQTDAIIAPQTEDDF